MTLDTQNNRGHDYWQVLGFLRAIRWVKLAKFDPKLMKIDRNQQNPVLYHLIDPYSFSMGINDFRHTKKSENNDYWQVFGFLGQFYGWNWPNVTQSAENRPKSTNPHLQSQLICIHSQWVWTTSDSQKRQTTMIIDTGIGVLGILGWYWPNLIKNLRKSGWNLQ